MTKLLKTTGLTLLLIFFASFIWLAFGEAHGDFTVTINGQQVEGAPKLLMGSVGMVVAAVAVLFALGIGALALAGSGFLVFCTLVLIALMLLAVAVPFLLPLIVPIVLVGLIVMIFRQSPRSKRV